MGTGDVAKGPTSETGFWVTYDAPLGGYSIYLDKPSSGPSIYAPVNSYFLPQFVNYFFYQNFTTAEECYQFLRTQDARFVTNRTYEAIITSGLTLMMDPSFLPSYPVGGDVFYDLSLNAFTGSNVNLTYQPNNYGVVEYDGTSYINNIAGVSNFSFIQNSGVFTISAWVKPSALNTNMYFIGNGNDTTTKGFKIGKNSSNDLVFELTKGVSGEYVLSGNSPSFFADTAWVNIILVGDGTDCYVYKNGALTGEPITLSSFSSGDSSQTLTIGKVNGSSTEFWNGAIGSVLIYNVPFTQADVTSNYTKQYTVFNYTQFADQPKNSIIIQNGDQLVLQEL
jgi:hypothetical protein